MVILIFSDVSYLEKTNWIQIDLLPTKQTVIVSFYNTHFIPCSLRLWISLCSTNMEFGTFLKRLAVSFYTMWFCSFRFYSKYSSSCSLWGSILSQKYDSILYFMTIEKCWMKTKNNLLLLLWVKRKSLSNVLFLYSIVLYFKFLF